MFGEKKDIRMKEIIKHYKTLGFFKAIIDDKVHISLKPNIQRSILYVQEGVTHFYSNLYWVKTSWTDSTYNLLPY